MATIHIETKRLWLRPFQDQDLETFVAYRSDPDVARHQGWEAPYSLEKGAAFIEIMKQAQAGVPGEWYQVAFELKENSELIGDCAFRVSAVDAKQAEIGFTIRRQYQGQGYATEGVEGVLGQLFGELGLHRVHSILRRGEPGLCQVDGETGHAAGGTIYREHLVEGGVAQRIRVWNTASGVESRQGKTAKRSARCARVMKRYLLHR